MKTEDQRLSREQVGSIVTMLRLTTDRELNCSECLQHVGEYAETRLAGKPLDEILAGIEQHLELCPECREEFLALQQILKAGL